MAKKRGEEWKFQQDVKGKWGHGQTFRLFENRSGCAVYEGGARVHYGLTESGSSDLVVMGRFLITQDMVGAWLSRFGALELKKPNEQPEPAQHQFIRGVNRFGGRAGWANSMDMADRFFDTFFDDLVIHTR